MSYSQQESDSANLVRGAVIFFSIFVILEYMIPGQDALFTCLMIWQYVHMYIIGRKETTFDNFDGVDLLTGIPVLYFFFTCPGTYLVSAGLMYMITGKESCRIE